MSIRIWGFSRRHYKSSKDVTYTYNAAAIGRAAGKTAATVKEDIENGRLYPFSLLEVANYISMEVDDRDGKCPKK